MWSKREDREEKEEKVEAKEQTLLEELCGGDAELYDFLRNYLYFNPLAAISEKDLDILTEEAEKSGSFRLAVDKAIFEAAQNPGERESYIKVIQDLASKTIHATEQEKGKLEKEGLTDRAARLGRRIENQEFMSERVEDIIDVASKFYNEKLVELGENVRREERREEKKEAEREEMRIGGREKAGREARKKERRKMGREEKREAEKQDKREELAAEEGKEARREKKEEAAREEMRIGDLEKAGREARRKERAN
ncbi:MAG: hypothetical protein ACOC6S_03045 [Chloroflexota bacterium]